MPGLSATPCTSTPGEPSFETMRCERSPAPFDVPPDSTHHVAGVERGAHRALERDLIVRKRAERHRLAAGFRDRGRHDGAVAVVDLRAGRAARPAPPVRRRSRAPRPCGRRTTSTCGDAAGRQHADLARRDARAAAQHQFAARDVGAGVGDELPGRGGAAHVDRRRAQSLDQLGVLDHHHRIGAARHHAAGRDRRGGAGTDRRAPARWPQTMTSRLSASRRGAVSVAPAISAARSAKPSTLARSNGGTSIGASTSCASTRPSAAASATRSAAQRRQIEMARKARARLLGGDHFEKLLLPRRAADGGDQLVLGLSLDWAATGRSWPRSYHDLRARRIAFAVGGNRKSSRRPAQATTAADSPRLWVRRRQSCTRTGTTSASPRRGGESCASAWP